MIVVFTKDDQKVIAWAWQRGEDYALEMGEREIAALASWIEGNTQRIYSATGSDVSPESRAMALVARLRGMIA